MNIRDNKGISLISLTITIIILLIITGAMIFNTKNQLSMKKINALRNDIDVLSSKVDDYYLKYGELPILCEYCNISQLTEVLRNNANQNSSTLNIPWTDNNNNESIPTNPNDGLQYAVIDLEKLGGLTLNYGYNKDENGNGEYFTIKESGITDYSTQTLIYIINTTTHQIYFPHGIFENNMMYYTF